MLTLSLSFCIISPINTVTTYATSQYLRVITDDTPFYQNPLDTSPTFFLPYTYYVKVIGTEGDFTHVECYGTNKMIAVDGYVPTTLLYDDGLPVSNPFVNVSITTVSTAVLYLDSEMTTPLQYVFSNRNLKYYGLYKNGDEVLYFVEYNGKLGYISEDFVYPFAIANHPNELTFIQVDSPEEPNNTPSETPPTQNNTNEQPNEDFFSLKIIIIVCLLFAGIVALFIALKQSPKKPNSGRYYDENDYE